MAVLVVLQYIVKLLMNSISKYLILIIKYE